MSLNFSPRRSSKRVFNLNRNTQPRKKRRTLSNAARFRASQQVMLGNRRVPAAAALRILARRSCKEEPKWQTKSLAITLISDVGVITNLSPNVAAGNTVSTRIGNRINAKKIIVRYTVSVSTWTLPFYDVRVILGTYEGGVATTVDNILQTNGAGELQATKSFYQSDTLGTFQIMYDKVHTLRQMGPTQITSHAGGKLGMSVNYASGVAAIPKNIQYFIIFITNTPDASKQVNADFSSKVTWTG